MSYHSFERLCQSFKWSALVPECTSQTLNWRIFYSLFIVQLGINVLSCVVVYVKFHVIWINFALNSLDVITVFLLIIFVIEESKSRWQCFCCCYPEGQVMMFTRNTTCCVFTTSVEFGERAEETGRNVCHKKHSKINPADP